MAFSSRKQVSLAGLRATLPFMLGMVPFGLVAGVSTIDAGRSSLDAVLMSVVVFSGIVQIPALQLYGSGIPSITIVLITFTLSLRMLMYSLSIAPQFKHFPKPWRAPLAYMMTDPSYALSMHHYASHPDAPYKHYYFATVSLSLWLAWQFTTLLGTFIGQLIPAAWSADFVVPLVFTSLLFASLRGRNQYITALVGGLGALVSFQLPYGLGLIVATILAVSVGVALDIYLPDASSKPTHTTTPATSSNA
ncbi:MAG: AzlC family ABC transporter permease [Deinococcota bacterium]